MRPEITLIRKYGRDPLMSKRIFLDQRRAREQARSEGRHGFRS